MYTNTHTHTYIHTTYSNGGDTNRRMVVKSPVHTARVRVLLEMFPNAQFVYVHRDPYVVLQSSAHMADAYYWYVCVCICMYVCMYVHRDPHVVLQSSAHMEDAYYWYVSMCMYVYVCM